MQEANAQMALRLHQMTGEPLAHCSYLLDQTKGDYETALKILERILEQRTTGAGSPETGVAADASPALATESLEDRVFRLETQLGHLTVTLTTMSDTLTLLLDKLSPPPEE